MFSRENRRFFTLSLAIVVLAIVTLLVMVHLIDRGNSAQVVVVTAFVAAIMTQLITMLRSEQQHAEAQGKRVTIEAKVDDAAVKAEEAKKEAEETKKVVQQIEEKTNGNLSKAIETTANAVRAAERDQLLNELPMPKTSEELRSMLHEFSQQVCDDLITKIGKRVAEETVRQWVAKGSNPVNQPPQGGPS